ncbi:MAG: hypothetical protein RIF33_04860 [Cyclobacteriaceae bacterium]
MNRQSFVITLLLCGLIACQSKPTDGAADQTATIAPDDPFAFEYTAEAAPEWTKLFYRKSGWFGADGIFSIPLSGVDVPGNKDNQKTLLIFSDTYIGEVGEDNAPLPGNTMVNNTIAYVDGLTPSMENIRFHYKQAADGQPETFFVPNNANAKPKQYYWMGDGFINQEMDNKLHLFAYHVSMTGPGVFDFAIENVSLLAIPDATAPPFDGYEQLTTPLHIKFDKVGEGDLGAGVFVNTEWAGAPNPDGFVYVYGCIGAGKQLVAARVIPSDFETFDQWQYWNGDSWSADIREIAGITENLSNELSVTPLNDGRYLLTFQVMGISDKVGVKVGMSPVGPFGPTHEVWVTPEINEPPGIFPYNAKAHPNLSQPGELLISYNTITADFWNDIQKDAHIYRPRFIKLQSPSFR